MTMKPKTRKRKSDLQWIEDHFKKMCYPEAINNMFTEVSKSYADEISNRIFGPDPMFGLLCSNKVSKQLSKPLPLVTDIPRYNCVELKKKNGKPYKKPRYKWTRLKPVDSGYASAAFDTTYISHLDVFKIKSNLRKRK